jgi:hypothetical protein
MTYKDYEITPEEIFAIMQVSNTQDTQESENIRITANMLPIFEDIDITNFMTNFDSIKIENQGLNMSDKEIESAVEEFAENYLQALNSGEAIV